MKKTIIILMFLLFQSVCFAATLSQIGIQPFNFDIGARPLSMGGANSGIADDQNACFYNPGALPFNKGVTVFLKDINNLAGTLVYPLNTQLALGASIVQTTFSNFTSSTTGQTIDFSNSFLVLSTAAKLDSFPILGDIPNSQNIGVGINLKSIIAQTLAGSVRISQATGQSTYGWEVDAGIVNKISSWLGIGLNFENILPYSGSSANGGTIVWDSGEKESIPLITKAGFSIVAMDDAGALFKSKGDRLVLNGDIKLQKENAGVAYIGLEWKTNKFYYLRTGSVFNPSKTNLTFGLGFKPAEWSVDFTSFYETVKGSNSYAVSFSYEPEDWFVEKFIYAKELKKREFNLVVIAPSKEIVTYESQIPLIGTVAPFATVKVNGQTISLNNYGSFEVMVPLLNGKNLIIIEAIADNIKQTLKRLVFKKAKIIVVEEKAIEEKISKTENKKEKQELQRELEEIEIKKEKAEVLATMGIVEVSPKAEVSFDEPITRGELASWIIKAMNLPLPVIKKDLFNDVPSNHPFAPYIKLVVDNKLMESYDNYFKPDKFVSKSEAKEIFKKFGVEY